MVRWTDFKPGDHVRLTADVRDASWGGQVIPAGTTGKLGRLYRVQDGIECWAMHLDKAIGPKSLLGVGHDQIARVE